MKAAWLADIHLNFLKRDKIDDFLRVLSKESVNCFLMSGDIGEADSIIDYLKMTESILGRPFYFVMGNHDFYRGSIKTVRSAVSDFTKTSDKLIWLNEIDYIGLTKEENIIAEVERSKRLTHDAWEDYVIKCVKATKLDEFKLSHVMDKMKLKMHEKNDRTIKRIAAILKMNNFESRTAYNKDTKKNHRVWSLIEDYEEEPKEK